jgi:holin-like protein
VKFLVQVALIFCFGLAGEAISHFVNVPASVCGIIIMFIALCLKLLRPAHIELCADWLNENMALFFLPASVALIEQFSVLGPALFRFILVCIFATIITFFVTYFTVFFVRRIMASLGNKTKGSKDE